MPVDHRLVDDLEAAEPRVTGEPRQPRAREAPIDERVSRVDLARLADANRGLILERRGGYPVGLQQDAPVLVEAAAEDPEQAERVLYSVQDPEAEDQVEQLVEPVEVEGVEAPVFDLGPEQGGDRAKTLAALELDAPPGPHPLAVLLVVDRDDAAGAARLGEKGVEAVEGADVEDA